MGIIFHQAQMLMNARHRGVPMRRVLMIGRQSLLLHPRELRSLQKNLGIRFTNYKWGEYADRFFIECLGAEQVDVLDNSPYEGANILHDLSQPVSGDLKGKFDLVVEAGTLEHVFNFPVAIANLMQMTRVGGILHVSTVSNNLCGHGFYQFSPELIFRVFTEDNGFKLGRVFAAEARYPGVELSPSGDAYEVTDPASIGCRVGLVTKGPVMLFFEAQRTADQPLFAKSPMQSDYTLAWQAQTEQAKTTMPNWIRKLRAYHLLRAILLENAPSRVLQYRIIGHRQLKRFSFKNRQFFKKV